MFRRVNLENLSLTSQRTSNLRKYLLLHDGFRCSLKIQYETSRWPNRA